MSVILFALRMTVIVHHHVTFQIRYVQLGKVVTQTVTIAFVEMLLGEKVVLAATAIASAVVTVWQVVVVMVDHAIRAYVGSMMMVCHRRQWRAFDLICVHIVRL